MVESSATVPRLPSNQGVLSRSALGEYFARTMAALHDAAMKNRKRLFFDLIKGPLEEWRASAKEKE